ncbi:MAG: hypothetical protein KDA68_23870, partial [Planctomycetaceae bacterium]|nr:hypothetical protein [Planctomycetaceae bacterium]
MPSTSTTGETAEATATATPGEQLDLDRLLDLDLEQLGDVKVRPDASQQLDAPSSNLSIDDYDFSNATTPGELLEKSTSVNVRRTSSLNLNTTLRVYQPSQINSTANGMN